MLANMNNSEDDSFLPASLRIGYRGSITEEDHAEMAARGRRNLLKGINSDYADYIANQMHYDARDTRDMIIRMKMLIEEQQQKIEDMKQGFEGSCMACEPVGVMNRKLHEEQEDTTKLTEMMGAILAATANVLKGDPLPNQLHSWHDLPELARRMREERDAARREVCRDEAWRKSPSPPCTARQVADRRGWDCFKENTND